MRLIGTRERIWNVAESYRRQYGRNPVERFRDGKSSASIQAALDAINPGTATAGEVAAIIGNDSWSYNSCAECGERIEDALEIGHSDSPLCLCPQCIRNAYEMTTHLIKEKQP